jgi:hypothetical protein
MPVLKRRVIMRRILKKPRDEMEYSCTSLEIS